MRCEVAANSPSPKHEPANAERQGKVASSLVKGTRASRPMDSREKRAVVRLLAFFR